MLRFANVRPVSNLLYSSPAYQTETGFLIGARCRMDSDNIIKRPRRREILKATGALASGWMLSQVFPEPFMSAEPRLAQQSGAAAGDALAAARSRFGKVPISS